MRKKKGNLSITVVYAVFLTTLFGALLTISMSQTVLTKKNAERVAETESLISLTSLCADAFLDDLETNQTTVNLATVSNPTANITLNGFAEAARSYQEGLQAGEPDENGYWTYVLSSPYSAVLLSGSDNDEFYAQTKDLLLTSEVKITVFTPVSVYETGEEFAEDEGTVNLGDLYYDVELTRGTTRVTQSYYVTGLIMEGIRTGHESEYMVCRIKETPEVEITMMSQIVARNNTSSVQ